MAVPASEINAWLAAHPDATQSDMYQAMVQSGTTPQDLAGATGWDLGKITSVYNGFANPTPAPAPAPAPAAAPPAAPNPYAPLPIGGLMGGISFGGGGAGTAHYNAPTFNAPTLNTTYTQSPYIQDIAASMGQQSNDMLGRAMQGIQSNAIGIGGLGGSRQGIAQGTAAGQAASALQGNLANLYNTDYNNALNRQLQQYNSELGSATTRYGADSGAAASMYGADKGAAASMYGSQLAANASKYGAGLNYNLGLGNLGNTALNNQMDFYTAQRGQDLAQLGLGAQLYGQGNAGYLSQGQGVQNLGGQQQQAPWQNLNDYNNVLGSYSGFGQTSTTGNSGGGAIGAIGGAGAGSIISRNLGLGGSGWQPNTSAPSNAGSYYAPDYGVYF